MWAEAVGIEMGVGWSLGVGGGQEAGGMGREEKRERGWKDWGTNTLKSVLILAS